MAHQSTALLPLHAIATLAMVGRIAQIVCAILSVESLCLARLAKRTACATRVTQAWTAALSGVLWTAQIRGNVLLVFATAIKPPTLDLLVTDANTLHALTNAMAMANAIMVLVSVMMASEVLNAPTQCAHPRV